MLYSSEKALGRRHRGTKDTKEEGRKMKKAKEVFFYLFSFLFSLFLFLFLSALVPLCETLL